jgi:PelA/Pel-15E family pectate lyase
MLLPCVALATAAALSEPLMAAPTPGAAKAALVKAVKYYHDKAASHGGYVYRYSADFKLREAEGIPAPDTIWIQPPGTPAVGAAFLDAYEATGDKACLDAAVDAAHAVTRTQLASGGWDYSGHFDAANRKKHFYRRDLEGKLVDTSKAPSGEAGWHIWRSRKHHETNYTTLDDDVTQSALRLLVRVDQALNFKDAEIHEAAEYALKALLNAQYPIGAWSASVDTYPATPPDESKYPIKKASYPASWSKQWNKDFTGCYVTNDDMHAKMVRTLLLAGQIYKEPRYTDAAKRAGDFLLQAVMPNPQPAWAQQYDAAMQPVWSRQFEPPAVSGRESQAVMWSLLTLTAATGDKKFLEPIPAAVAYFRKSLLPDGRIARFYELENNKPAYFKRGPGGKGWEYTNDDDKTASNYGWKWDSELDAIESTAKRLSAGGVAPGVYTLPPLKPATDSELDDILRSLTSEGAWAEKKDERGIIRDAEGKKTSPPGGVLHSETFVKNVGLLCAWLKTQRQ